jgi:hypothetical protein
MDQTIKQVAEKHGNELALKWADHRTECLESEVRRLRQYLRLLSEAVIAGDTRAAAFAQQSLDTLASDR